MKKVSVGIAVVLIVSAMSLWIACDGGSIGTVQKDCVVWIGDSIFALSGEEANVMEDLSGHAYRTYYVSGAQMEGGLVQDIPSQYAEAVRDDSNIRTVIMDGGGNDVLIGAGSSCNAAYPNGTLSAACHRIMDSVEAVNIALWQDMIDDGVENIIDQGYYYSSNRQLWMVSDVFQERTKQEFAAVAANNPGVKMIFIEPKDNAFFDPSRVNAYTVFDGIHPTDEASEVLANMLWDAMVANGIEQTDECSGGSSSGSSGGCN